MEPTLKEEQVKFMLEDIIFKIFQEHREIIKDIFQEIIEDIALANAIEEGRKNDFVEKNKIIRLIENEINI